MILKMIQNLENKLELQINSLETRIEKMQERTSPVTQTVKRLPTMWETWVQSLGREDLLEKGMATHSSVLAWGIPGMGEPCGLPSLGSHRVGHD